MAEVQKRADHTEQEAIQKTPEEAAVSGVVAAKPNQDVFGEAKTAAHANDRTLSEPELIAMNEGESLAEYKARVAQIQANRFGFFDTEADNAKVFEKSAKQAVEPPPSLSPILNEAPYNSSVTLNVQITNVPEVSEPLKPEELLQYADATFEAGAQAVRPIENYMAQPNAVTDSLLQIGPALDTAVNYYANASADKVIQDAQTLITTAGAAVAAALDHPLTPDERAKAAGTIMPMFFFEGDTSEPIRPETIKQLGLEGLTETELAALAIRKTIPELVEFKMPEFPPELNTLEFQQATADLLKAMERKGRTFSIATEGSEDLRRLQQAGAQGGALGDHITLMENPRKITALEEFLHGTQRRLPSFAEVPDQIAEVHVKNFMMRHAKLLGLDQNDLEALEWLKKDAIEKADRAGYTWLE